MPRVGDTVKIISDLHPRYYKKKGVVKSFRFSKRFPYEVVFKGRQCESFQEAELKVVKRG